MIEEHNPDIDFDWTRILKGGPEPAADRRQESRPPRPERSAPEATARVAVLEPDAVELPVSEALENVTTSSDEPVSAVQARLGSEGLSRLRGRYAEALARISDRIQEPEKQAELKTLAERLNPDAWVTEEDVIAGLDGYEATFEALRSVIGHRRRRRRRRTE